MGIRLLVIVVALHVANIHHATCSMSNDSANNYIESVQLFGQKSFQAVHENQPGNLIYSPAGASVALSMLGVGARGKTLMQIVRGLQVPKKTTRRDVFNFVEGLNSFRGYELRAAYKLFYNKDRTSNKSFIYSMEKIFKSPPQGVDFARFDNASQIINDWCAAQTNQRIKKIVNPGDISDKTEILLLNAIYFKADWKTPFNANYTKPRIFYVNGNTPREVPTMYANENFRYGRLPENNGQWFELPYAVTPNTSFGDGLSMFIILPRKRDGLPDLMKNFHKIDLKKELYNPEVVASEPVEVYLPRFKLESDIDLQKPLEALGFTDMFTDSANISGIIEGRQLSVDRVFQKALIEVNEKGTEAAVVTGVTLSNRMLGPEFIVDHPFIALIMKGDGTLLFVAVITDPW